MPSGGKRYWCVGGIDGAINFVRSMPEWTITVSLFEVQRPMLRAADPFGGACSGAWLTYLAVRGSRSHPHPQNAAWGQTREDHAVHHPSLDYAVVSFGMSHVPEESSARLKRCRVSPAVRPTSSASAPPPWDLCKVADGTYDARISKRICTSGTFPRFPPEPSWSGKRRGI